MCLSFLNEVTNINKAFINHLCNFQTEQRVCFAMLHIHNAYIFSQYF